MFIINFAYTNSVTVTKVQLSIASSDSDEEGTTATNIKRIYNSALSNLRNAADLNTNGIGTFIYDGSYWVMINTDQNANDNTIPAAYCGTASTTVAKTASCTNYVIANKSWIQVILANNNTAANPTLNINSKGAKAIKVNGASPDTNSASPNFLPAGSYFVYYDGSNYHFRTDGKLPGDIAGTADTVSTITWDKISNPPASYTASAHSHGNITNAGTIGSAGKAGLVTIDTNNKITTGAQFNTSVSGDVTTGQKFLREDGTWVTPKYTTNTNSVSKLIAGGSTSTANAAVTSGNVYLRLFDDATHRSNIQLASTTGIKITSDANGIISIGHSHTGIAAKTAAAQSAKTLGWGGTFTIYEEKYDTDGHITGVANYNMTMPGNPNTDTKVTQTASTTASWKKVLLSYKDYAAANTAIGDAATNTAYASVNVSVQPSTNTLSSDILNVARKVSMQYNTTDNSLDFVFI